MMSDLCEENAMYEVKSDPLEESFAGAEEIAELRAGMADLKARLDGAAVIAARPALAGGSAQPEVKQFVEHYLRHGSTMGVEVKAIEGTSPSAGGYAVPREIDATIDTILADISPIRALANVVRVGSSDYRKLVATGGVASGWAAEDGARAETATPVFAEIAPPMGDLFANPAATQAMLDDAAFDLEGWLANEIAQEFARAEGEAFVNGDGATDSLCLCSPLARRRRSFSTMRRWPGSTRWCSPSWRRSARTIRRPRPRRASAGSWARHPAAPSRGRPARSPAGRAAAGASSRPDRAWRCGRGRTRGSPAIAREAAGRWRRASPPSPIRRAARGATTRRARRSGPFSPHCVSMA
jgi:hypothetical protein